MKVGHLTLRLCCGEIADRASQLQVGGASRIIYWDKLAAAITFSRGPKLE